MVDVVPFLLCSSTQRSSQARATLRLAFSRMAIIVVELLDVTRTASPTMKIFWLRWHQVSNEMSRMRVHLRGKDSSQVMPASSSRTRGREDLGWVNRC